MESKSRIVLIHGNRDVRRKLASGLARSRFEVFEAEGRGDGLPLIYQVRPVVILLEADDEREETWETCSRIRLFTSTPMVLLTISRPSSRREPLIPDNVLVLEPPISPAKVVSAANTLLNRQLDLGPSAQRHEQAAAAVGRVTDSTLQDQLTWLSALLSKIKRAPGQDQIADSIVLNHLLGILQADWIGLYRTDQSRPASLSDVECLLWPGKKGWTEEYEQFFGARVIEAIGSQQLIVQATGLDERVAPERKDSPPSIGDYVIIPLMGRERTYGALAVIRRSGDRGTLTPIQVQFVNTVGEALALAMDNADLARQTREGAIIDRQTGMFSSAYLERIVRMENERRNRYGRPFSLILLDWATGDSHDSHAQTRLARKLEQVAGAVRKQLRSTDVVARRGDRGIVFVLPETDSAQAQRVADRLLQLVQTPHPDQSSERCPDLKARVSTTLAD